MATEDDTPPSIAAEKLEALLTQIPLNADQLQMAAKLIHQCSVSELDGMGLDVPTFAPMTRSLFMQPERQRLRSIQEFISQYRYNHMPGYHFDVRKRRPFFQLMETAEIILHARLPIKCIEAVFLGIYLTAKWKELDRWTLSFKTMSEERIFRHIVLIVHDKATSKFGALGMSRQESLMFKDLIYDNHSNVVESYLDGYKEMGHDLISLRFSLPVEHDILDSGHVGWNCCILQRTQIESSSLGAILDQYFSHFPSMLERFRKTGFVPRFKSKTILEKES